MILRYETSSIRDKASSVSLDESLKSLNLKFLIEQEEEPADDPPPGEDPAAGDEAADEELPDEPPPSDLQPNCMKKIN